MARISQYKSLGTKLGGYKTTLSKVQSMEYAKKHADWKAGEQKALYGQIGGSVANIIGIAKEANLARKQEDFMAREFGIGGDKFAERVRKRAFKDDPELKAQQGMTEEQINEQFWADESNFEDFTVGQSQVQEEVSDVKKLDYTSDPNVTKVGGEQRGATQYKKLSPSTTTAEDDTSSFPSAFTSRGVYGAEMDWDKAKREGMWKVLGQEGEIEDITTARNKQIGEDALKQRMAMKGDPSLKSFDSDDKVFDSIVEDTGSIYGPPSPTAAQTKAYEQHQQYLKGLVDKSKTKQNLQSAYQGPVDAKSLALEMAGRGEAGLPKPTRPEVTDDFYGAEKEPIIDDVSVADPMDFLTDEFLGDYSTDQLPPTMIEQQFIDRMKERGIDIGVKEISELVNQFASVETGGKDIRQITPDDKKAGRKTGTGKGAGFFQFETGDEMGFETGLNRVENMYKDRGKKVPDWVAEARKAGSPIGLPKHIQRELLLANLYQQEQSVNLSKKSGGKPFDIMERAFENMDFSELWAKKHWAGAADEYESKIQQFQRDKERFKF